MTPRVSFAKTKLDYPLYTADFDPYGRGYLLVGGGGGESKTGVANKISLLDVSDLSKVSTAAELQLSKDEDSPNTLASLATKDGLITFAGINSSVKDQQAGRNEHLRTFTIDYPVVNAENGSTKRSGEKAESVKNKDASIAAYARGSLFRPDRRAKPESYQRVLRLSPARRSETGSKRIGAIATGLGESNEVLLFNATNATPTEQDIIQRVTLDKGTEAGDVDVLDTAANEYSWAYCTDHDVYLGKVKYDFDKKRVDGKTEDPVLVYSVCPAANSGTTKKPVLRSLRFLSPNYILLSTNLPSFGGVQILLLKLYKKGSGEVVLRKKLPSHVKATTGLDTCILDADPKTGARQIVAAVAGGDRSVTILVLDYHGTKADTMSTFRTVSTTKDVHELQITGIRLSPFNLPATKTKFRSKQYIQLATVSMGNTVVVDTLYLEDLPNSDKSSRYVLMTARSAALQTGASTLIAGFVLLIFLLGLQGIVAINYPDSTIGRIQLHEYIPAQVRDVLGSLTPPGSATQNVQNVLQELEGIIAHQMAPGRRLKDIMDGFSSEFHFKPWVTHVPAGQRASSMVVIRNADPNSDDPDAVSLSTEFHPDPESLRRGEPEAKRWDDLDHEQKEEWKQALVKAGAWAVEEGETVLKGIFFSSYAGAVGDIVAGAIS